MEQGHHHQSQHEQGHNREVSFEQGQGDVQFHQYEQYNHALHERSVVAEVRQRMIQLNYPRAWIQEAIRANAVRPMERVSHYNRRIRDILGRRMFNAGTRGGRGR